MAQTVIGFFDTTSDAQKAIDQLVSSGFSRSNIDLSSARDGMTDSTDAVTGSTGATTGYSDTSTSTGYSDATTTRDGDHEQSGIGKFFSSLFGGDDDDTTTTNTTNRATTYGQVASQSDAIVTVHASSDDEAQRAADMLDDAGAFDIDERAEQYGFTGTQNTGTYGTTAATTLPTDVNVDANDTIKVIQEDLQVGKRTVETGGVRVRSRIVEKPVEESLRLREERVRIQRTPVNRVATDADLNAFKQGEISVTEHAEVPVVNKEARVVEEISVGKEVNEREETIRDTVRSTEVDVEDTTDVNRVKTTGYTDTDVNRTTGTTGYSDSNTTPGTNL